ncbi:uncharacterized protein [Watersipora subatra]|uniref:uncharacterized protein n=1 Tax=Watersipora subatra TaxID=2589382 RepID=UPI00355BD016
MKISTLTDTEGTDSMRQVASGLLVCGFHQSRASRLPPCISTSKIPFNSEEIPNATSVQNWPHLQHLASQFISAQKAASLELGLLIGNNLPHVFISRQEISKEDHEPFARLTDLGWILMGNATNPAHSYNSCAHTIQSETIVNLSVQQPTTRRCISFKIKTETFEFPNTDKFEQQILKEPSPENWRYVPTDQNPANHASRGLTITQLLKSNWLTGPDFLWKEPMQFPYQLTPEVKPDDPEVKSLCVQTISSPSQTLY